MKKDYQKPELVEYEELHSLTGGRLTGEPIEKPNGVFE